MDDELEVTRRGFPAPVLIAGAVAGLAGFVIAIEKASWSSVDGRIVDATYRNWGALGAGVVAIGLAGLALATLASIQRRRRTAHVVAAIAVLGLGGVQVARGLGAFWSPPGPAAAPDLPVALDRAAPTPPAPAADATAEPSLSELERACVDDRAQCAAFRAGLARQCDRGELGECGRLAGAHIQGLGGDGDMAAGRAAAIKACDGNDALGCANLAYYASAGEGGPKDGALALDSARRGCEGGEPLGCRNVAAVIDDKLVDPPLEDRRKLLDLACGRSAERGCEMLADDLLASEDDLNDNGLAMMRRTLLRLCQLGNRKACLYLANAARQGIGGPEDAGLATRARRRGCSLGEGGACGDGETAGSARAVRITAIQASDGGDHLDRIDALERAFLPCAEGLTGGARIEGKLGIAGDQQLARFELDDATPLTRCMMQRNPYEMTDDLQAAAVVTIEYEVRLRPP